MEDALYFTCILVLLSQNITIAAYTLTTSQSVSDGQTLTSQSGRFELGFFSPSNTSKNRYVGIWYKNIPVQTVVWVANREAPLHDASGVMKLDTTGNIVIVNKTESLIWSSRSVKAVENPIIEFLESGNLVVREAMNGDSSSYIWQSFDHPGDTMLPGMKIGWNLRTGMNRYLSSWRKPDDPSHGNFTAGIEIAGYPEIMMRNGSTKYYRRNFTARIEIAGYPEIMMRNGYTKYYRSGSWSGIQSIEAPDMLTYHLIQNEDEIFFRYQLANQSAIMHYVMVQNGTEGHLERLMWVDHSNSWSRLQSIPRDRCDEYDPCGMYSTCDATNVSVCQCLQGFQPRSPQDLSQGCEREVPLNCSNGDGFRRYTNVKLPETNGSWFNVSMNLEECRLKCLGNCSCTAYANSDITEGGSGCILWFTDLVDIKQYSSAGQDLYIRMPPELEYEANSRTKRSVTTIVIVTSVAGTIVLGFASWYIWKKRSSKGGTERDDLQLPLFSLSTTIVATDNFSAGNKLGEGGFGPVYKGKLGGGQEIAVKRLSKNSAQGVDAFKNEVILISKLQHRNLVKLLGCCIHREEKMLVYEYMPNNSLDSFIFNETRRGLLDWPKRLKIIQGIAEGVLYLHRHSRLRIIHRDLKASNVLLDSEMLPKISDFGMARIFGGDQAEAKTKRVVGTYGYMSPEYVIDGNFSEKSDVFSFGVLVLEIICGKRNWGFRHSDHELNLLGHAWNLCSEDRSLELVDKSMSISGFCQDVERCIHIGLLCVQKGAERRPTMPDVVTMLSSDSIKLPKPQQPGFYMERSPSTFNSAYRDKDPPISNDFTVTLVEGR